MDLALSLVNVQKSYGIFQALNNLHIQVSKGSVCGLLGPNGAGKTTTLRLILGLIRADGGQLTALDLDCWNQSLELRKRIGFLGADMTIPGWLTPRKAIQLVSEMRGQDISASANTLAQCLDLDLDKAASKMSRGNQQKIGLMLALAPKPELLIFDEPTSGLDPLIQEVFAELIKENQARGATILLSSHTFSEVDRLCEQVIVVRQGQTVASESLNSFRQRALRKVRLTFTADIPESLPERFENSHRQEQEILGVWRGPTPDLVSWCAQQDLADIEISAPQLDDAFLDLYR